MGLFRTLKQSESTAAMSGKFLLVPILFLSIVSFKQYTPGIPSLASLRAQYHTADHLYNLSSTTGASDSACMLAFKAVIRSLQLVPRQRTTDSLMYQSFYKLGVLSEVYLHFNEAASAYLQAIHFSNNTGEKLRMYIFAGAGYYNLNNFDSASFFLLQAEENAADIGSTDDRVRLYNTLGVLYFDNGNFLQSKNYFTQALRLTEEKKPVEELNAFSIKLNMATCYYKLGMFDKALNIYHVAADHHMLPDALYMNMGMAYSRIQQYTAALNSFKKVKVSMVPGVLNEMARAAMEAGKKDSAMTWLNQYQSKKKSLHTNALDDGINALYQGDLDMMNSNPADALRHDQVALNIFSRNFSSTDIRKNPVSFTGSFAYYRLFDVLIKKAAAWELLYKKKSLPEDLKSAFETFQSTISLLSYIEKSYEMDDAKILLKQKSGEVYANALAVCLKLNKLYPRDHFIEQAFVITEKNKASVMASQIRDRNFLNARGTEDVFIQKERNIRYNIARLNAKTDERLDFGSLQKINEEKSVYESELVGLHRKMEENKSYYQMKYTEDFPSVKELQNNIGGSQALISFYNTESAIEIFVMTKSSLDYIHLDSGAIVRQNIMSWIQMLQSFGNGGHLHSGDLKTALYRQFMKPLLAVAGGKEEWIIIPDGLFFLLPVESLPGNSLDDPVITEHEISYAFSARFITNNKKVSLDGFQKPVLSLAPFSKKGADLQQEGMGYLEKLPYSNEEIAGLSGNQYLDSHATKEIFLENLNRFPILHLATHAVTDLKDPSASFISFYPASGLRSDDFLFLDELYGLKMDSCQLIVISACETGRGKLVSNEGVMSFARAFLYAGCPSTVNTLWKADDRSTALILKQFYIYLKAGYTKSKALRKAKLDFIVNNPLYRNPAYWSHLVLTGNPDALYEKKQPGLWVAFGVLVCFIMLCVIHKRREKKVDVFHSQILDV